ncbi:hypothetical protein HQ535_06425 [bacterium]|nr:hypothetical protein [bacterium]
MAFDHLEGGVAVESIWLSIETADGGPADSVPESEPSFDASGVVIELFSTGDGAGPFIFDSPFDDNDSWTAPPAQPEAVIELITAASPPDEEPDLVLVEADPIETAVAEDADSLDLIDEADEADAGVTDPTPDETLSDPGERATLDIADGPLDDGESVTIEGAAEADSPAADESAAELDAVDLREESDLPRAVDEVPSEAGDEVRPEADDETLAGGGFEDLASRTNGSGPAPAPSEPEEDRRPAGEHDGSEPAMPPALSGPTAGEAADEGDDASEAVATMLDEVQMSEFDESPDDTPAIDEIPDPDEQSVALAADPYDAALPVAGDEAEAASEMVAPARRGWSIVGTVVMLIGIFVLAFGIALLGLGVRTAVNDMNAAGAVVAELADDVAVGRADPIGLQGSLDDVAVDIDTTATDLGDSRTKAGIIVVIGAGVTGLGVAAMALGRRTSRRD